MKAVSAMLITALYTVFVQNLVMTSGLGMSEAMRVSNRPGSFLKFAVMISGFSTVTGVLCYIIGTGLGNSGSYPVRAAVYGAVLAAVYIITALFFKILGRDKEFMGILGIAALNTLVYAVPYIGSSSAYTFAESLGSGLGAGAAFVLAAAVIGSGANAMEKNKYIPDVFKGTPTLFFYVGIISLGFVGFTGRTPF